MTEAKHSPAPWVWSSAYAGPEDEFGCHTRGPVDVATFESSGHVANLELMDANGDVIVSAGGGEYCPLYADDEQTQNADGYLIASAPDLKDALENLMAGVSGGCRPEFISECFDKAQKALAKSRGEK